MESYLMMLYVTLEQESALKNFFVDQGWRFCKPDLSVTTDKVGPSVTTPPVVPLKDKAAADDTVADQNKQSSRIVVKEPESTPKTDSPLTRNKGKRKTESPQATSTNVKQPKVLLPQSTVTVPKSSESVSSKTEVVDKPLSSSSNLTPITVLGEDGKHFTIKIEQDADDLQENVVQAESRHDGICANSSDNVMCNDNNSFYDGGDDNFHDDGDDVNDESTDMDYSNDGALGNTSVNTENQLSAGDSMGSASLKGSTKSKGKIRRRKRQFRGKYEKSKIVDAYNMVKDSGMSIRKAAKMFNIPRTTLFDRVKHKVDLDVTKPGPEPILTLEEERKLSSHLNNLAYVGYGYTQVDFTRHASDYAISLGKKAADKPFSKSWYIHYRRRHPESELVVPFLLQNRKDLCTSEEKISNYYEQLNCILFEYHGTPQRIFIIEEIDLEFEINEQRNILTIIGAGNAAGEKIPPYFVMVEGFDEEEDSTFIRKSQLVTKGFRNYLSDHFFNHVQMKENETIIVLYDGHKSHLSVDLIEWAKEQNIVLFVLPPQESCIVKTRKAGVFEAVVSGYEVEYKKLVNKKQKFYSNADVVAVATQVYDKVVNPVALRSWFENAGVYSSNEARTVLDILESVSAISKSS
ncbi:uncharacterized protein LOC132730980 isoform X1 [Ruditapes philippinarum]|uniref:uncharacterized protein LOC132730980 isoform X1 n=1 Tax=Ruditapes philippinarum TaxID=129788 RepID=UPI00295B3840|nr:uncharacterized protein LOC132730980 isoform X1 [Ruditapes philippinarum]XP_060573050.1 uncharacterized protein LOC132730980 isoform X1 [Ruditapes philippinarum]